MYKHHAKCLLAILGLGLLSACSNEPMNDSNNQDKVVTKATKQVLLGEWYIEYIEGYPVFDRSAATLMFSDDNKVSGNATCNRMMSTYAYDNATQKLTIKTGAVTKKMCFEAAMRQENKFLAALPKVSEFTMKNGLLLLRDDDENVIFKASKIITK